MNDIDYSKIKEFIKGQSLLDAHSIHGTEHWRYVERNGLLLADLSGADKTVVRLFALFHDSRRFNDGYDTEHGHRGAELALKTRGILYNITDYQFDLLTKACEWHTKRRSTGIITIDTCFDADRLDLPRAGYIPDPVKMATTYGAKIAALGVKMNVTINNYRNWISTIDISRL